MGNGRFRQDPDKTSVFTTLSFFPPVLSILTFAISIQERQLPL